LKWENFPIRNWWTLKVISSLIVISGLFFINIAETQAGSFFETVGISTAVGTVLGASTLPFASNPGDNIGTSLTTGAAAGAIVGLGLYALDLWDEPSDHEKFRGTATNKLSAPSFSPVSTNDDEEMRISFKLYRLHF